jgi:hypothetical protein
MYVVTSHELQKCPAHIVENGAPIANPSSYWQQSLLWLIYVAPSNNNSIHNMTLTHNIVIVSIVLTD